MTVLLRDLVHPFPDAAEGSPPSGVKVTEKQSDGKTGRGMTPWLKPSKWAGRREFQGEKIGENQDFFAQKGGK
jgi:hypothetical protein